MNMYPHKTATGRNHHVPYGLRSKCWVSGAYIELKRKHKEPATATSTAHCRYRAIIQDSIFFVLLPVLSNCCHSYSIIFVFMLPYWKVYCMVHCPLQFCHANQYEGRHYITLHYLDTILFYVVVLLQNHV